MAWIARTETLHPHRLKGAERVKTAEHLAVVNRKVFEDPERADVLPSLSTNGDATLLLFYSEKGDPAAYTTFEPMSVVADGVKQTVIHIWSVVRRPYRNDPEIIGAAVKLAKSWKVRHPFSSAHWVWGAADPSMYTLLTDHARGIRPSYRKSSTHEEMTVAEAAADALGLKRTSRRDSLVRRTGVAMRQTIEERTYWLNSERRTVQFFLDTNPEYASGNRLMTTMPISFNNLSEAMNLYEKAAHERKHDRASGRTALLQQPEAEVSRERLFHTLRNCDLFRFFPEREIEALAGRVEGKRYNAGEYVFHKGEHGDALFIVAKGTAEVLLEADGEEFAIARLGKREIFGEMAVLTGDPRMASVRAAGELALLRVDRDQFLTLLARHPEIRDPVWNTYAKRLLENVLRVDPRFHSHPEDSRRMWVEQARRIDIPKESGRDLRDAAWLFLVTGEAEVENGAERVSLYPREVVAIPPGCRMTTRGGAMICLLPAAHEIGLE